MNWKDKMLKSYLQILETEFNIHGDLQKAILKANISSCAGVAIRKEAIEIFNKSLEGVKVQ